MSTTDTIAGIATPPGRGGVGIIRVSGSKAKDVAEKLLGATPKPRYATHAFFKREKEVLDDGLALFFNSPYSFTGEDVLELQGHGSPIVLDALLAFILTLGVRQAEPGEFSKTCFF